MRTRSGRIHWQRISSELVLMIVVIGFAACQSAIPSQPTSTPATAGSRVGAPLAQPERLVTDAAGVLTAEEVSFLEADLDVVEERGLAQMLVYIAPSLPPGENLEEFTLRAANAWRVGHTGVDDGLVIFVFVADRKVRIEVGLGLESVISDEAAGRIIAEHIAPAFRREAYGEGLRNAVQELTRLLALKPDRSTPVRPDAGGANPH